MGTHAVLERHGGGGLACRWLDLFYAVERHGEAALDRGDVEFVALNSFDAALHAVAVYQLDEVVLRADGMGRRAFEPAVPFLDAQVADAHGAPALVHDADAAALACEALWIEPFADQLAVDRHGDEPLVFVGEKLEARLGFIAEARDGRLAEVGERRVFFDRQKVHRVAVDLDAVKAAEVRLVLLGGKADRLQRVGVQREGQMHRAAPLEVERGVRAVRQVQVTGDGGGGLRVEPAVVVTPVAGLTDGLVANLAVCPAIVTFRPLKDRLQPLGQRGDLADGAAQQLHPPGVPGVEQEMLRRGTGEVAAEVVAVDKLHLAEIAGGESANGGAVQRDPGELAGVEV